VAATVVAAGWEVGEVPAVPVAVVVSVGTAAASPPLPPVVAVGVVVVEDSPPTDVSGDEDEGGLAALAGTGATCGESAAGTGGDRGI